MIAGATAIDYAHVMVRKTMLAEMMKLSAAERILLLQDLWDSVADDPEAWALTDDQCAELDRRLDEFDALRKRGRSISSLGSSWPTVKRHVRHKG